jgi:hypothetical protein
MKDNFEIVASGSGNVLHVNSKKDHPIIVKGLGDLKLDLAQTPLLEWKWRIAVLPNGADLSQEAKSDSAAEIHIVWSNARRTIGYAWDETLPVDKHFPNPRRAEVHFVIVGSGRPRAADWLSVTRDAVADHKRIYGSEPSEPPDQIAISVDSNQTESTAESYIGAIAFRAR